MVGQLSPIQTGERVAIWHLTGPTGNKRHHGWWNHRECCHERLAEPVISGCSVSSTGVSVVELNWYYSVTRSSKFMNVDCHLLIHPSVSNHVNQVGIRFEACFPCSAAAQAVTRHRSDAILRTWVLFHRWKTTIRAPLLDFRSCSVQGTVLCLSRWLIFKRKFSFVCVPCDSRWGLMLFYQEILRIHDFLVDLGILQPLLFPLRYPVIGPTL